MYVLPPEIGHWPRSGRIHINLTDLLKIMLSFKIEKFTLKQYTNINININTNIKMSALYISYTILMSDFHQKMKEQTNKNVHIFIIILLLFLRRLHLPEEIIIILENEIFRGTIFCLDNVEIIPEMGRRNLKAIEGKISFL